MPRFCLLPSIPLFYMLNRLGNIIKQPTLLKVFNSIIYKAYSHMIFKKGGGRGVLARKK